MIPTKLFYEFGEFRLDTEKHRLLRQGEIVALTPKAVEALTVLIQRRGKLVERDELMNSVWRDATVEPGNLDVTISRLRKALGENENGRKFIQTVPRLGYKFVADVREVAEQLPALVVEKQTLARMTIDEEISLNGKTVALLSRLLPSLSRRASVGITAGIAIVLAAGLLAYFRPWRSTSSAAGNLNIKSIAVVPLKSFNRNTDDDALSLGFADALTTSLGKVKGVRVLSANAVSRRADLQKEAVEIGRDLRVDSVLEGTLQRANGKLRVTLRLIRTNDGAQIWSGSFDEAESDIFKLQDAMAAQTAQSLEWNLSGEDRGKIARRYTANRDAYQAYLRGRFFFDKRTLADYARASIEFERALTLDPNYALPYTGLADVYAMQASGQDGNERDALYEKSRAIATKALTIDESLAEAHTSLGWIKRTHDWDWAGSEREFKRALELDPNNINAHQWYALLLITLGRKDEALAEIERARELAPLSTIVLRNYFVVLQYRGDSDQLPAVAEQITTLGESPSNSARIRSLAYSRMNNHAKAIEIVETYEASHPGETWPRDLPGDLLARLAIAYSRSGQQAKAREIVRYLARKAKDETEAAYRLAVVYGELERKDEAIALLQKCLDARDDRLVWLRVEPNFESVRNDARFQDLLRKMNL